MTKSLSRSQKNINSCALKLISILLICVGLAEVKSFLSAGNALNRDLDKSIFVLTITLVYCACCVANFFVKNSPSILIVEGLCRTTTFESGITQEKEKKAALARFSLFWVELSIAFFNQIGLLHLQDAIAFSICISIAICELTIYASLVIKDPLKRTLPSCTVSPISVTRSCEEELSL